jgi:hypothetical protein
MKKILAFAVFLVFLSGFVVVSSPVFAQMLPGIPVYGNWCGPDHPRSFAFASAPVDPVDAACMRHDYCVAAQGEFDCGCDIALLSELRNMPWPNPFLRETARGIYDAIALTPCRDPNGMAYKQSLFMKDLYFDTVTGRGTPMDVMERWRKLIVK